MNSQTWGKKALFLLAALLILHGPGCGSAIDPSLEANLTNTANETNAPITFAQFDAVVDPNSNQMISLSPTSTLAQLPERLLGQNAMDFLANVSNVAVESSTWQATIFDGSDNSIRLYEGEGACLTNNNSDTITNLKVKFEGFSDNNVVMNEGAYSSGDAFYVDYQDVPGSGAPPNRACRTLALSNTSSSSYSFRAYLQADGTSGSPVNIHIERVSVSAWHGIWSYLFSAGNWRDTIGDSMIQARADMSGKGFGTNATIKVGTTLIGPITSKTDTFISEMINPFAGITENFINIDNPDTGFNANGPYIIRRAQFKALVRLPASSGTVTSKAYFAQCPVGGTCTTSNGCLTNAIDFEVINNLELNDATSSTVFISNLTTTGNSEFYFVFDLDQDGVFDNGDPYEVFGPTTISVERLRLDVANEPNTLDSTVTGTCP